MCICFMLSTLPWVDGNDKYVEVSYALGRMSHLNVLLW